jgi:hypothetical protein
VLLILRQRASAYSNPDAWAVLERFARKSIHLFDCKRQLQEIFGPQYLYNDWKPVYDTIYNAKGNPVEACKNLKVFRSKKDPQYEAGGDGEDRGNQNDSDGGSAAGEDDQDGPDDEIGEPNAAPDPRGVEKGKRKSSRKDDKPDKKRRRKFGSSAVEIRSGKLERKPQIPLIPLATNQQFPIIYDLDGEVSTDTFIFRVHS